MRLFLIIAACINISLLQLRSVDGRIEEGTYILSNVPEKDADAASLVANPPGNGKKLGDVLTEEYEDLPAFHWQVKKVTWLFTLTSQANPKNTVTETEQGRARQYRFVDAGNKSYRIENIVGRRTPSCLKNNGPAKPVSLVNCRQGNRRRDPTLLWTFTNATGNL